jgi:hypothetical protein
VLLGGPDANHGQVAPVITSVATNTQVISTSPIRVQLVTVIRGTLANVVGTSFRVDLYTNDACDPSGAGEGQKMLGTANVGSTGAFSLTTSLLTNTIVTAIARSPDGDTSQFSTCAAAPSL